MKRFIKYIGYCLFLPIWWLQLLIPRNKNIWVFGSWYGLRYSDNSRYLFEYVNANDTKIQAIWVTKKRHVKQFIEEQGFRAVMAYSFSGIYYSLRARIAIVSCLKKDVNELCINGATKIQLWHGNPMKKIGLDDKYSDVNKPFYQKVVKNIFSMAYEFDYEYVVSNAPVFTNKMASAFNVEQHRILETGCPRNDVFYLNKEAELHKELRSRFKGCSIIYYLPTFRNQGQKQSLLDLESYNENQLQIFLEKTNMIFVTKAHFATKPHSEGNLSNTRIFHLPNDDYVDINFLLKDADILVTDYSGAYFDYLLTERPIIFAAFDLEDYLSASREMYFKYPKTVAGPIIKTWDNLYKELENHKSEAKYKSLLAEKNDIFNKYHDNNNSKRVFESILKKR